MLTVRSNGIALLGVVAVALGAVLGLLGLFVLSIVPSPAAGAQVLLSAGLVGVGWVLCLRPKLLVSDFGVAVVNPLSTTFVAWTDLDACGAEHNVWIRRTDGTIIDVYAVRTDPERHDRELERLLGTLRRRTWRAQRAALAPRRRPRLPAV